MHHQYLTIVVLTIYHVVAIMSTQNLNKLKTHGFIRGQ